MLSDVGSTPTISTIDIEKQALCLFFCGYNQCMRAFASETVLPSDFLCLHGKNMTDEPFLSSVIHTKELTAIIVFVFIFKVFIHPQYLAS